jgi:alkylation response protein AidB-like acyl-CoA dehydrogenase
MEFGWTAAQTKLYDEVVAFARARLNEDLRAADAAGRFPHAKWAACAAFGIQGLMVPPAYGGRGLDGLTTALAMEGLGYGCRDNGLTFGLNAQIWTLQPTLAEFGSAAQNEAYLRPLTAGTRIGAYAMTEPEAGSDAFSLQTRAEKVPGGYRLNGEKALITFAPLADFALVFASTDPAAGRWGLSAFLVDAATPGYTAHPVQEKMGLRTVPIGRISLHNCTVAESQRLGSEGAGAAIFSHGQTWERACILASQVGAMARQLEESLAHATTREQFGQPIGRFQAVSHRLVDMKLRLETARLLLYRAAWQQTQGRGAMLDAALAKLYLGDAFVQSSLDAVTLRGGRGYLTEYEIERDLRDAVAGPLYGGTAGIQRNIIARLLGVG